MVTIICPSRYKINRKEVKQISNDFLKKAGIPEHYLLNIIFIGRNKMKTVALKYKGENEALPVLSFSYDQGKDGLFGEIFICYPQMILLAAEREKKIDQILSWLIKHGIDNLVSSSLSSSSS
jgi:ssRNA-specific RNase YbeY (16S rRNA maturation enzyme)